MENKAPQITLSEQLKMMAMVQCAKDLQVHHPSPPVTLAPWSVSSPRFMLSGEEIIMARQRSWHRIRLNPVAGEFVVPTWATVGWNGPRWRSRSPMVRHVPKRNTMSQWIALACLFISGSLAMVKATYHLHEWPPLSPAASTPSKNWTPPPMEPINYRPSELR
jgi:hypothetical protein